MPDGPLRRGARLVLDPFTGAVAGPSDRLGVVGDRADELAEQVAQVTACRLRFAGGLPDDL